MQRVATASHGAAWGTWRSGLASTCTGSGAKEWLGLLIKGSANWRTWPAMWCQKRWMPGMNSVHLQT